MNSFDAVVYACLILAVVMGFNSGLLRSLATIFGYLAAAPVTVALVPSVAPLLIDRFQLSSAQILLVVFAVFVVLGMMFSALFRRGVSAVVGPTVSAPDRMGGAVWERCASACSPC